MQERYRFWAVQAKPRFQAILPPGYRPQYLLIKRPCADERGLIRTLLSISFRDVRTEAGNVPAIREKLLRVAPPPQVHGTAGTTPGAPRGVVAAARAEPWDVSWDVLGPPAGRPVRKILPRALQRAALVPGRHMGSEEPRSRGGCLVRGAVAEWEKTEYEINK